MHRFTSLIVTLTILFVLAACSWTTAMAAAPARVTPTTGTVKLNAAQLKTVENARCGQIGKAWLAGSMVGGKFLSHAQRAANYRALAARAHGVKAKKLRAQASKYIKLSRSQAAACKQPNGAVKLPKAKLKAVSRGRARIQCGQLGRSKQWISGTLAGGYFTSHSQQSANFKTQALFAKGAAKRRLTSKAESFRVRANSENLACRKSGGGGGGGGGSRPVNQTKAQPQWKPAKPSMPAGPKISGLGFNFAGAKGLALNSNPVAGNSYFDDQPGEANDNPEPSSNLEVVKADGSTAPAVALGTASIAQTLIAENGITYLVFKNKAENGCLLAEVRESGDAFCVDDQLQRIDASSSGLHPSIQLDELGAVYYRGYTTDSKSVIRRALAGSVSDLLPADNVSLRDFIVLRDGSVIVQGTTMATQANWTRRIKPGGGIQSMSNTYGDFIAELPDRHVYFGVWGGNEFGIRRFFTDSNTVEDTYWVSGNISSVERERPAYFNGDLDTTCHGGSYCTFNKALVSTPSGKAFIITQVGDSASLVRLFPDVQKVPTAISKPTKLKAIGNTLVLAGLNATGQNIVAIQNTDTGDETVLIDPNSEVEVYHLNPSSDGTKLMFDGLRFSDGKYVLGQVDITSKEVTFLSTLSSKWEDFQTFG